MKKLRAVQFRSYPSVHRAFKLVCADNGLTIGETIAKMIENDINGLKLDEKYKLRIASRNEQMSAKINFEICVDIWEKFKAHCRKHSMTPTSRANALCKREILEHSENYFFSEDGEMRKYFDNYEDLIQFIKARSTMLEMTEAREKALELLQTDKPAHVFYGVRFKELPAVYFSPIEMDDISFLPVETFNRRGDNTIFALHS